jgi:CDP-glycerol glycerophosphotransferase (TagB/SpsB family)
VSLAPDEPALVQAFVERLAASEALGDLHLVVRLHPLETGARWDTVRESSSRVTLMSASTTPSVDGRVPWLTLHDQARLVSTLLHAAACINIASTMTLDAAILDRPVIGVEFSGEPAAPRDILYEEYGAEHYRPLVERGGLRLARRWDELLDLVRDAIRSPERDAAQRADMVRHECGLMDGRAAERVAEEIARLTTRAAACRRGGT